MPKKKTLAQRINVMRAAVMGANDGILSVAGIVVGVAGATSDTYAIFISGMSGMLAGTVSMAMGEWVSVNTQKDSQQNAIRTQKRALKNSYDDEFNYVKEQLISDDINPELANQATKEMMAKDALGTTVRQRYGFNMGEFTNPFSAAIASMISFPLGSILPMVAITCFATAIRVQATILSVIVALSVTGFTAAHLGNSNKTRGVIRNVVSGLLTMIVTYTIGRLIGGR
ncbi:VIT family protein [Lentilactobacillus sp. Marseille-Q4993]|uniref:VIT1/CCC1 transporter family protein n=1 Tax=Lentilactobacillus sp. Marseille-Q4993 TaxID=3039492 RepID=UPI0024BC6874|nr:VIT family protein [Lentilactobacillus sp. Marseille-Q4993]